LNVSVAFNAALWLQENYWPTIISTTDDDDDIHLLKLHSRHFLTEESDEGAVFHGAWSSIQVLASI
jgi:hypothetical protein